VAALLFCVPPLTWAATGVVAAWAAARRGKSWRWGFALGFFFSTGGIVLAALPRNSSPRTTKPVRVNSSRRMFNG
jgi:hypothetical protein